MLAEKSKPLTTHLSQSSGGNSPPGYPTPSANGGRPTSTDRPHAPPNAMSPSQGLSVLGTSTTGGSSRGGFTSSGHSPRPESRSNVDTSDVIVVEEPAAASAISAPLANDRGSGAGEDVFEQEFDLMLRHENENFSQFLASGSNTVNAPVMVEIRGKLAAAKLAAGQPRPQKPPAVLPMELGTRSGAGNPMGFESPAAAAAPSLQSMTPLTPMPRLGAASTTRVASSVCNFCGSAACTGQCPRGRDISPLMASAVPPGVIVATPNGGHAFGNPSPLQQPSWLASTTTLKQPLVSPHMFAADPGIAGHPMRPSSAAEELITSPAGPQQAPSSGTTPRASHKRSLGNLHLDPGQSPGPSARAPRTDSATARGTYSSARQASVATASVGQSPAPRAVAVLANSSKPRRGVPKPKAQVGSDCSSTGSSTRTQPQRFSEFQFQMALEQRSRPTRKKLCKSEGSVWSEGSISAPSPTKVLGLAKTMTG